MPAARAPLQGTHTIVALTRASRSIGQGYRSGEICKYAQAGPVRVNEIGGRQQIKASFRFTLQRETKLVGGKMAVAQCWNHYFFPTDIVDIPVSGPNIETRRGGDLHAHIFACPWSISWDGRNGN